MKSKFDQQSNRLKTNCYKWDTLKHDNDLPFWVADSDYPTDDAIIEALIKRVQEGIFGYTFCGEDFKNAIITWYNKRHNLEVKQNWIIPMTGVVISLKYILESLNTKTVIIQTPVYHAFRSLIESMGLTVIENPLINVNEEYSINFFALEALFKQGHKTLILCSPHNPIGRIWQEEELQQLSELVVKYNVNLISDEIHSDICMPNNKFTSMLKYINTYDNLILCNAPSKTFNIAGLNTSYIIVPNTSKRQAIYEAHAKSRTSNVNLLGSVALVTAYNNCCEYVEAQNEYIYQNYLYVKSAFLKNAPKVICAKLEATYLMWINLSYLNVNQEVLMKKLNENGVIVSSGTQFSIEYQGYIRFNIACPLSQVKIGVDRILKTINDLQNMEDQRE